MAQPPPFPLLRLLSVPAQPYTHTVLAALHITRFTAVYSAAAFAATPLTVVCSATAAAACAATPLTAVCSAAAAAASAVPPSVLPVVPCLTQP